MTRPRAAERRGSPAPMAAYAAAWVVLWAVYTALFAASGVPVGMAARAAAAAAIPPALVGLAALSLAKRWPWPPAGRWRLAARLVAAIAALAVASVVLWLLLVEIDLRVLHSAGRRPTAPIVAWQCVINFLLLSSLAGVGYARHEAEALRDARGAAARAEALRARAELQLLRSQVQPHFILNVLHALLGLVRRDPARAEAALERLGELLRFGSEVHQAGRDWVPLSREWDFVTSYLELERVRLGSRLAVSADADDGALDVAVPPFALQPLVENAIVHGVAPRAGGGRIEVSARREDGRLRLSVRDDGPGASEEQVTASPRTGLRLLRERLAALYAGRARMRFETPPGGGFGVVLDLPDDGGAERP
ncbi:MAG TPA: histidine kinase [Thermoanaerobaculia bacterium]|nr:histidine kinase [Thermoanaerobaculia bacterium]